MIARLLLSRSYGRLFIKILRRYTSFRVILNLGRCAIRAPTAARPRTSNAFPSRKNVALPADRKHIKRLGLAFTVAQLVL
jgi:hypothetical protein